MIEVTLNKNIVPCRHAAWPLLHPLVDLTEDPIAARRAIYAAERFFLLGREAVYSGFARKMDAYDGDPNLFGPCFYVQVWNGDALFRTVAFRDFGYVGILHVQLNPDNIADNLDRDLLGAIVKGLDGFQALPPDYAARTIVFVQGDRLHFALPYASE